MKPEAQIIAIAEARGWRFTHRGCGFWKAPKPSQITSNSVAGLPKYLNDLNAIAGAIVSLPVEQQWHVFAELTRIVDASKPAFMGSAAQYSEAFLRCLGKWEDSP